MKTKDNAFQLPVVPLSALRHPAKSLAGAASIGFKTNLQW
jgi:hypothetical protein